MDLTSWKKIKDCLIQHLTESRIQNVEDVALLKVLESRELSEGNIILLYLYALRVTTSLGLVQLLACVRNVVSSHRLTGSTAL